MSRRPPTDEVVSLFDSLIITEGVTTAPGNAGGTSFIDAGLIGSGVGSFARLTAVLYLGDPRRADVVSTVAFNNATGEINLSQAYKGIAAPIPAGVTYSLVAAGSGGGSGSSTVVPGSVTANWQAAEQALVTIGADGVKNKLHMLNVNIVNLAGKISIRMQTKVNGSLQYFFPVPKSQTFDTISYQPVIPVVNGSMGITEAVLVTVQSDNVADNGKAVDYEYLLEAM